jgi:hypothetical protein
MPMGYHGRTEQAKLGQTSRCHFFVLFVVRRAGQAATVGRSVGVRQQQKKCQATLVGFINNYSGLSSCHPFFFYDFRIMNIGCNSLLRNYASPPARALINFGKGHPDPTTLPHSLIASGADRLSSLLRSAGVPPSSSPDPDPYVGGEGLMSKSSCDASDVLNYPPCKTCNKAKDWR